MERQVMQDMEQIVKKIDGPMINGYGRVLASCTLQYGSVAEKETGHDASVEDKEEEGGRLGEENGGRGSFAETSPLRDCNEALGAINGTFL